jgi:hypothetical protein
VIDVRIQIRDGHEYHLLTLFVSALDEKRSQERKNFVSNMQETTPPENTERPVHADDVVIDVQPVAPEPQVEGKVVGSITPKPEGAISETEMEAIVQKSLETRGLADTRELIVPITGGKRWREAGPESWPAIKAALEAK